MSAIKYIKRMVSLDGNDITESLPASFFNGEQSAHVFIISAMREGQALTLSGTVTGKFLNSNDATISLTGSIVDGCAVLTLADDCYALPGRFTLSIDVAGATVYECQSSIKRRSSNTSYDPDNEIDIDELWAEIDAMRDATSAATAAVTAAGNVDIDLTTGTNEATVTVTRANGTTKSQTIRAVVGDDYTALRNEYDDLFSNKSTNLFNKYTLILGKYLNNQDQFVTDADFFTSDYIPVEPNATYKFSTYAVPVNTYTVTKEFKAYSYGVTQITIPSDVYYIRVSGTVNRIHVWQINKGSSLTDYEEFSETLKPGIFLSVESGMAVEKSSASKNLFDKLASDMTLGKYLQGDGTLGTNENYTVSGYIAVFPNTRYVNNTSDDTFKIICFYGKDKQLLSPIIVANNEATSPENAWYIRFNVLNSEIDSVMLSINSLPSSYVAYESGYKLRNDISYGEQFARKSVPSRLYNLSDCIQEWRKGNKFPIAFYGDSTTEGAGTTGFEGNRNSVGINYINQTAYPYLLEQKLKAVTGNNTIRVYNAGFSGTGLEFALNNAEAEFVTNLYYNDVKMVGIAHGLNDRISDKAVTKSRLISLVEFFYAHGIQPFIVTPQVVLFGANSFDTTENAYEIGAYMSSIIRSVADDYNLETVDMNYFTANYLGFSEQPIDDIIADVLHFANTGNQFMADVYYSILSCGTIFIRDNFYLSLTNPLTKYTYVRRNVTGNAPLYRKYVQYDTANTASDGLMVEADIFNDTQGALKVTPDLEGNASDLHFYMVIDGTTLSLSELETFRIGYGYHSIKLYTGVNSAAKYYGMKFEKRTPRSNSSDMTLTPEEQSTIDQLVMSVSGMADQITANEQAIAGKAAASALTSLEGRVGTLESATLSMADQITANEQAIAGKAAASALTSLEGRVGTLESATLSMMDDGAGNVTLSIGEGSGEPSGDDTVTVQGVSFASASGSLTVGNTATLTPIFTPANATNKNGAWSTSNSGVATVSGGLVTAVSAGSAVITFTSTDGGYTATYTLTVAAAPAAHSNNILNPASEALGWSRSVGEGKYLKVSDDGKAGGLSANNSYQYCGCYDISALHLSGKTVVFNVRIRTMILTAGALNDSYRSDTGIAIIPSSGSATAVGATITFPEFDESVYTHLSFSTQSAVSVLSMFDGDKPLYMSDKTPYSASDVDEYSA